MNLQPVSPTEAVSTRATSGHLLLLRAIVGLFMAAGLARGAIVVDSDLCIYGGTSGGVAAAVQAARMGKSVSLAVFGNHLGGLTSGGLGATDVGNPATIGGVAREFYREVGRHYGQAERFNFEPHVAREIYQAWLAEARVQPRWNQRLASVARVGQRITELRMEDGTVYRAKMFIDATYEGDLMAMAGVSFTFGREGTNVYGESLNGVRANTPKHQFTVDVDPYVMPGKPASGLLPFIELGDGGNPGDGDQHIQAFNYRMCFTRKPTNRLAHVVPPGYEPARYELLGRLLDAHVAKGGPLTINSFFSVLPMPNGKTDMNNNGAFSTDYIGANWTYPTNTYLGRAQMDREHLEYIQGLIHYLATSPRSPPSLRAEMSSWGPCKDEWPETGGYSPQIYVREARRMISDYVMTQADCQGAHVADNSICLGSYNMDSHNCQRIVQGGFVRNEGDVQAGVPKPYPISYRSIVPRAGECENVFVPFALSASHIAFGSTRMEPVFMMAAQSAATAAALAIDDSVPVQKVDYTKLAQRLEADGQILNWHVTAAEADAIFDAYNRVFYFTNGDRGYYRQTTEGGKTWFWERAEQMEMVLDTYERTTNAACLTLFSNLFNGFVADHGTNWSGNPFNDDIMWMVIASARAHQKTGNPAFRDAARNNFDLCYARAWSTNLGGGLWWKTNNLSKNACVNGPASIAAALLYRICGDKEYLAKAEGLYQWERATLFEPSTGQVFDNINLRGALGRRCFTYNEGTFIGAANLLGHTNDARLAADYTMNVLCKNGLMPRYGEGGDAGGFNGICARWLARFMKERGLKNSYQAWLQKNADAAWEIRRRSDNLSWCKWNEPTPSDSLHSWGCSSSVVLLQVVAPN